MTTQDDLHEPQHFTKRRMWRKMLKERGIEIDCELDHFIMRMDSLLHARQYADASEGFHSSKMPTIEEVLSSIRETVKQEEKNNG